MFFSYDFRYLSERWFSEALPVNYDAGLTIDIGSGDHGTITIEDRTKTALAIEAALANAGGANASAAYSDGVISVTLGTKLSTTIGSGTDGTITIVDPTEDALAIEVVLSGDNDAALSASFLSGKITVTLGTGGAGAADNAKNTATLVAAAINAIEAKTWVATASGTGVTPIAVAASKDATIVANDAKNTATLITAAINAVSGKTWTATASGTGATAITAAITETAFEEFEVDGTACPIAGLGLYDPTGNLYYVSTQADNTKYNTHWIKLTPSSL